MGMPWFPLQPAVLLLCMEVDRIFHLARFSVTSKLEHPICKQRRLSSKLMKMLSNPLQFRQVKLFPTHPLAKSSVLSSLDHQMWKLRRILSLQKQLVNRYFLIISYMYILFFACFNLVLIAAFSRFIGAIGTHSAHEFWATHAAKTTAAARTSQIGITASARSIVDTLDQVSNCVSCIHGSRPAITCIRQFAAVRVNNGYTFKHCCNVPTCYTCSIFRV